MRLSSRVENVSASLTLAITAKAKKMLLQGVDVIGFGSGEPDFDTPENIKKSAIDSIQKGFTKYTPASGTDELKKAVCEKFSRDNSLTYDPSQIVISCGAKHSLYNILQVVCDKGDEVLIPAPYWLSYPEMVKLSGAKPVFIETSEKDNFKISGARLSKAISKKTKVLIINSPSNPTGCVYDKKELEEIAAVVVKNNILVISDEIYEKITFDGKVHTSIASLDKAIFENTIVVNGVSKSFAMTGWRIGYLASVNKKVTEAIKNLQSHSSSNPTSISQAAALEAIKGGDASVKKMVVEFQKRRDFIYKRANKIKGLTCKKPEGAFYAFCRIDNLGLSSMDVCARLLDEAKVAAVPGKAFGSDEHIRLSFATSMKNIEKGMDRIEEWFKKNAG